MSFFRLKLRHDDRLKRIEECDDKSKRIEKCDDESKRNVRQRDKAKRNARRGDLQEMYARRHRQKGGATVEIAVTIPVIATLLIVIAIMINAGSLRLKCIEAAGSIARTQITDSDNREDPTSLAVKKIGAGAVASVANDGEWIRVIVEAPILGDVLNIFPLKVAGEAYVKLEDTS